MTALDRRTPPPTHELAFRIPFRPVNSELPGGMHVLTLPRADTPLVRLDFFFPGGEWVQTQALQARYAMQQMLRATRSLPPAVLSSRLDSFGATATSSCHLAWTSLSFVCLRRHLSHILPLIHSVLTEPAYDSNRLAQALAQGLSVWQEDHERVETVARELLLNRLLGDAHPLGLLVQSEDFRQLQPAALHAFHCQQISSHACTLLLSGGLTEADHHAVCRTLGRAPWGVPPASSVPFPAPVPVRTLQPSTFMQSLGRPSVQSAVVLGRLLSHVPAADRPLVQLVQVILGGYFGSRLMMNIRETKGYTYDIHSRLLTIPFHDLLLISTDTPCRHAARVEREVRHELRRLCTEPVGQRELDGVKNYMVGDLLRRYEPGAGLPHTLLRLLASGRTLDDVERESDTIRRATPLDILRIARTWFDPDTLSCCIVK